MAQRLKKGDIALQYVINTSLISYKKQDNKKKRAKQDITKGKIVAKNNYSFNPSTKKWEQIGREVKISFLVMSKPESYKRIDTVPVHVYPVTFILRDVSMGLLTPFRWRTGSFKRVLFTKPGMSQKQVIQIANQNIRNMRQLDFFFSLEALLSRFGLLWGPDTTNKKMPKIANPLMLPYFDKTSWVCVEKILIPLLRNPNKLQALQQGKPFTP